VQCKTFGLQKVILLLEEKCQLLTTVVQVFCYDSITVSVTQVEPEFAFSGCAVLLNVMM
jgi:hypothetical protein